VNALRQQLAAGYPIAFSVPVYTYWFTEPVRSSGDLRMPLATDHVEGGHAMCIVGYEDDASVPGGGFFVVRNSWGVTWANSSTVEPGYARMPYAYIASYGSSAYTAKVDGIVPVNNNSIPDWLLDLMNQIRRLLGR
jgi:C1A family cysteine protease